MKKLFSLGLVAMLALTAVVSSCGKYEEGSKFTFLSAKSRVVNDWKLTSVTYNGTEVISLYPAIEISFKKDDTYSTSFTAGGLTTTETGTWAFNSDKTALLMTATGSTTVETQTIVMLKSKMMKLKSTDTSGDVTIMTLEQQ
ncbi:MAG: hypothetical protein RI883_2556 [Bacteroidota bacterium]